MSRRRRCCRSWPTKDYCCALTTRNNGGSWPASARLYSLPRSPGANQVWQFEFGEYETISGGLLVSPITSRRYEFGWHWSPTANQHNFIAGVEFALAEAEAMLDGVRERAFGSLNYERLYREQNDDALDLVRQAIFVSSASGTACVRPQRHGAVG